MDVSRHARAPRPSSGARRSSPPGRRRLVTLFAVLAVVIGCASPPIEVDDTIESSTPDALLATDTDLPAAVERRQPVLWGGTIIASDNLDAGSQLEILAYPLDRIQRPRTAGEPGGRFLVRTDEYLETIDFAPGRPVTVYGRVEAIDDGAIGEANYRYPVLRAEELHLWRPGEEATRPRFGFGIGIGIDL